MGETKAQYQGEFLMLERLLGQVELDAKKGVIGSEMKHYLKKLFQVVFDKLKDELSKSKKSSAFDYHADRDFFLSFQQLERKIEELV